MSTDVANAYPPPPLGTQPTTPPPCPRCLRDWTRLGGGAGTADAAAAATSSPRTRRAPRPTSRRAWSTTHWPCMTARTTTRSPFARGRMGSRHHRPPHPRGRAPCRLRSWSHLGQSTRTMTRGRPFNRSSHPPRPCPPCSGVPSLRALTEDPGRRPKFPGFFSRGRYCPGLGGLSI